MTAATWLFMLLMVGCNAVFAAYEIALASISVGRLKALADQHRRGARAALLMKQNMEASLAALQLGITLVGAMAAALCELNFSPEVGNAFLLLGRMPSLVAHYMEEKIRETPGRVVEPASVTYDGEAPRELI